MTLSNKLSNRSSKGTARLRRSQVLPQPLFKKWAGWAQCSDSDALLLACFYVGDNSNMTLYVDDHTCFTLLTFRSIPRADESSCKCLSQTSGPVFLRPLRAERNQAPPRYVYMCGEKYLTGATEWGHLGVWERRRRVRDTIWLETFVDALPRTHVLASQSNIVPSQSNIVPSQSNIVSSRSLMSSSQSLMSSSQSLMSSLQSLMSLPRSLMSSSQSDIRF